MTFWYSLLNDWCCCWKNMLPEWQQKGTFTCRKPEWRVFFAESLKYSSGSVPSVKICAPALKYCRDVCRYWPAYCALSFSDLHMHQPKWQGCDQIHWQKKNWHISTEQCLIVLIVVGGKKQPKKEGPLAWKEKKNHRQRKDGCSVQLWM